ncbi:MAG: hypothetical protein ABIJ39_10985 [Chloroflexota bacterium]
MNEDIQAEWERFLDPKELRPNLIMASLYIAAFEILKNSIIERIRDFYITGFDENGWIIDPEYTRQVLSKDKSPTYASLKWLLESQAIDEVDIEKFNKVKECRNLLAHEITKFLAKGLPPEFPGCFNDMVALLDKIERWWIVNVEIPTNPDLAGKADEIDESGIVPGPIMSLRLMVNVALGSEETANSLLNEFKKNKSGG